MRATRYRSIGVGVAAAVVGGLVLGTGQAWAATPAPAPTSTTPAGNTSASTTPPGSTPAVGTPSASTAAAAPEEEATTTSIAEMDRTGNHQMGAGIAREQGETELRTVVPGASTDARARATTTAAASGPPPGKIRGFDISAWQPDVNFRNAYNAGARFAYIKATEGVSYVSPVYKEHYATARTRNIIRGGYVYAQPSQASGAATANYFFKHGGGWSADGLTLPPLLDIEYGSASQGTCYGKSWPAMRSWIKDFSNTVYAKVHRYPVIYTTTDWWKRCTNNSVQFWHNELFVALYPVHDFTTPGTLGASWKDRGWRFWQWASSGPLPGDQDVYRSNDGANLRAFAQKRE